MTREKFLKMHGGGPEFYCDFHATVGAAIKAAVEDEREECAKLAERHWSQQAGSEHGDGFAADVALRITKDIRARNK